MHEITDLSLLVVIVLYLTLATFLIGMGYQYQDKNKYLAYFIYGLAIVTIFIFMPLTIWYLADIGWITLPPPSNLTEATNVTL